MGSTPRRRSDGIADCTPTPCATTWPILPSDPSGRPLEGRKTGRAADRKAKTVPRVYSREIVQERAMSVEPGARPSRVATRRWMVRLFETSDKLEEHLNKSNLRPDQVTSVSVDQDGFFVVV